MLIIKPFGLWSSPLCIGSEVWLLLYLEWLPGSLQGEESELSLLHHGNKVGKGRAAGVLQIS